MEKREQWGSRIGLILAMAGNAVGLGNFLRFPVQAAQNGGGAFMIPYFVAFLLLAIPLMWVEWTIGRHGGKYQHGSLPGMFDVMWNSPVAKYLGIFGLFVSTTIVIYYTYIESWTLGFSFFSLTREYFGMTDFDSMSGFLHSYQGEGQEYFSNIWTSYTFLMITMAINFYILWRGISKGIEKFAMIAMPMLLVFGIFLAVWVFTIGTPDPHVYPKRSVWAGFAFIWNPNFEALGDSKIWLAAAGQVFFTLSVGMGTLQAYASYLRKKNDIALSGLATASLNEFTEVVLGATIAIPIAVAFFGLQTTQEIANGGSYNLGFVSMPIIFQKIPELGPYLGFMWFFLLFFAGITSSVAMSQPLISFLKEQFGLSHKKAVLVVATTVFIALQFVVFFYQFGFGDEMDYWAGTFGLVIVALTEVIVFAWIFGMDNAWRELNYGADIRIPRIFYYIIKYVTPVYLIFILGFWTIQEAIPTLLFQQIGADGLPEVSPEEVPYRWGARILMLVIIAAMVVLVKVAWDRNKNNRHKFMPDDE